MSAAEPAFLVVTAEREDRRLLFDVLDGENAGVIHTARDVLQARGFLEQEFSFDLVIVDFAAAGEEARAFCSALAAAGTPILGIVPAGAGAARWGWFSRLPGVREWIRSPVLPAEALYRVRQVLEGAQAPAGPGGDGYRFAFDLSDDEILVADAETGRIEEVNDALIHRSGVSPAALVGKPVASLDVSHTQEQQRLFNERLHAEGQVRYRFRKQGGSGDSYPAQMHARLVRRDGRTVMAGVIRDITPLVDAEQAFATLAAMHAGVGSNDGMQHAAQLLQERMGVDLVAVLRRHYQDEARQAEVLALAAEKDLGIKRASFAEVPAVRLVLEGESIIHLRDGQRLAEVDEFIRGAGFRALVGLPLMDGRRNVLGGFIIGSRRDLAARIGALDVIRVAAARFGFELELQESMEQGRAKGLQDALTSLPNRLLFNDRLHSALRAADRTGEMFAVVFVDLDRFKTINDSLGHAVGDQVLQAVARRLRASVRGSDTVARYAGDEFTLILRHIVQRNDALRVAAKIVRVMEEPLVLADESELRITVSVGVSFCPDDATSADELLKYADIAMYSAKAQGRNNVKVWEAVPEESHEQRVALEAKLRVAQHQDQLRVYYQPQVDARSEDIVGMEALIRWEHPELGMISPAFFIPIAEETGLIVPIGEWVLETACRQARAWQERFGLDLRIGVNLSAVQLRERDLVRRVERVLQDTGLPARLLELEVTESMDVRTIAGLQETLAQLRELGCSIAIDDFGTGQASLDYIRYFPADRVKIDQSFVRNIGIDPDDEAIVRATISMAHNLHHGVIAEGVEIEQHVDFLRAHGCEELQGYLFCRPLSPVSFENLLVERERVFAHTRPAVQDVQ